MPLRRSKSTSRAGEQLRKAAREAVKNLDPAHREAIEASGYGPGDAYIALWDAIVDIRKAQDDPGNNRPRHDYLRDRLIQTLAIILPYERPRLAVVQVKEDHGTPIIDLTKLPDARLQQLKEISLLLTGASGRAHYADDDSSGGSEAPGGEGAEKGAAELRKAPRGANGPR
jgi:hypothetical protein